jgi:uncharacterized protein
MVRALCAAWAAQDGVAPECIETHISFVIIRAGLAYKLKKALQTSYLNQSTLALREHACHEELRLNRRLAPALYLAVVSITGSCGQPALGGTGAVLDVAVQMRAFSQDALWDRMAAQGALLPAHVDELVGVVGRFHDSAAIARAQGRLGTPQQVRAPLLDSLHELQAQELDAAATADLQMLVQWEAASFARLAPVMARRLASGRVRECHGDLHLGNVAQVNGHCTVFDGIEFNDDFRWLDVISEVAFMAMDLQAHGLPALAQRWLNGYLQHSGDYGGVRLLNYCLVHRALVRAKVALMRDTQTTAGQGAARPGPHPQARHCLDLALACAGARQPVLMITHGYSGSGKTSLTQGLLEAAGAVRVRADIERKRMAGLAAQAHSQSPLSAGLYSPGQTDATYALLFDAAKAVLDGGWHAILDASFLARSHRQAARQLAATCGARFVILDFDAAPDVLRQRLHQRAVLGLDASEADDRVLALQMHTADALQAGEAAVAIKVRSLPSKDPDDAHQTSAAQGDWGPLLNFLTGVDAKPDSCLHALRQQ